MKLRSVVADALAEGLDSGTYKVIGYPGTEPRPTKRTVAVWSTELVPLPQAPSSYQVQLTVLVMSGHQDPARADDDLDDALGDVLDVLWTTSGVLFESATRTSINNDTVQAWTLTVTAVITATQE